MHLNIENFLEFTNPGYQIVRHLFVLSVAAFAAGLVYFIVSASSVAQRYRLSSYLSGVVMVSAAFAIFQLYSTWGEAFSFDPEKGRWVPVPHEVFSNGNRYVNWSIDVPMLLTQFLIVLGIAGASFWDKWRKFTIAGLAMVWTGYGGQFYESYRVSDGVEIVPFWLWFAVSSVFWLYLYVVLAQAISEVKAELSPRVRSSVMLAWRILLFSWILYPVAYVIPALLPTDDWLVVRQVAYAVADITSKLVFGIVLSRIALLRSAEEGFGPAMETKMEEPARRPV
ncbi:bacteriorhodopsin [Acuticoccus sp.]|uniref:bacteriorhodopsin n=1 Tax=Acuticoccus sp. TaxID=1904378 RepID=UPI003B519DE1